MTDGGLARLARRAAHATARPALLLGALATLACLPVLLRGVPWGHDTRPHVLWSHYFAEQLAAGEAYPRWLLDIGQGFGGPIFFVYPPLTYYLAAALAPLFPGPELVPWRLGATAWLAVWASALAAYIWLRAQVGRAGALFGAALYTLLPYHLMIDLHIRVALAELVAFVWPPLLLAAIDGARARPARALVLGALASAGLFLTHAPTALTALPLALGWSGVVALRAGTARPIAVALAQVALGAGLAGAYLATALSHGAYINEDALYSGQFQFEQWFLRADHPDPWVRLLFAQAVATAALCVAGAAALAASARRAPPAPPLATLIYACAAAALVVFFFMLPASEPLWRRLPLLARIQFPWRLSAQLTLLASASSAGLLAHALRAWPGARRAIAAGALGLVALGLCANLWLAYHADRLDRHLKPLSRQRIAKMFREQVSRPEHVVPRERDPAPFFADGARVVFVSGAGEARVEAWKPRHLVVSITSAGPARVALRQQFYPGWRAEVEGQPCCAALDALGRDYGILALDLPAGTHRVDLTLGPTPNERLGWLASGASLCALGAVAAVGRRRAGRT